MSVFLFLVIYINISFELSWMPDIKIFKEMKNNKKCFHFSNFISSLVNQLYCNNVSF